MIEICLIGTGGMTPLPHRFLASMLMRVNGQMILIDCGEGTQVSINKSGWGFRNIDSILFTHYHADHISGLPGLLLAIGNSGRTEPLNLYGPPMLTKIVRSLSTICYHIPFDLRYHELPLEAQAFTLPGLKAEAIPAEHHTKCLSYSFMMERLPKFDLERAKALEIPVRLYNPLQHGQTVEWEGRIYTPDMVLGGSRQGLKVCYITDSRPTLYMSDLARGADVFFCEGLYGDDTLADKAAVKGHMLFSEAAAIAKEAEVKRLILTHFSPSLTWPKEFLPIARSIFPNTEIGEDGMKITLNFVEQ